MSSYQKLIVRDYVRGRNMELLDNGDYFAALVVDKISEGEEVLMLSSLTLQLKYSKLNGEVGDLMRNT